MSRRTGSDHDPVTLGTDDPGEDVVVVSDGDAVILVPKSMSRLRGEALEVVADLQRAALAVHEAQLRVDELVEELRELGVSWSAIGWCTGMSDEGARRRWGMQEED